LEADRTTRFTRSGLELGGAAVPVYAGEMHYWRLDPAHWSAALFAMRDIGLRQVATYVPWGVHETARGRYDFTGARDLGAFLDRAAAADLHVILKPGPHINAELSGFGYPEWVLADSAMQAVTAAGTPAWLPAPTHMFPVPSYASKSFQSAVAGWYRAFADVAHDQLWPRGPVVALQVDNEFQRFFRMAAFDQDYHPDALLWWDEESGGREVPRAWDAQNAELCLRWVRFQERYAERAIAALSTSLDDVGLGTVARYHNAPPSDPSLAHLPALARGAGGLAGMDFYHRASDGDVVRERSLYLEGSMALPFAPEVGVGGPPWLPPMTEGDQQSVLLGLLASGVRAFNLFMTVDRERWYGAAIDEDGALAAASEWIRPMLAAADECALSELRREAPVTLVWPKAEARVALASSLIDPMTPVIAGVLDLGPAGYAELAADDDAREGCFWLRTVQKALQLAQVPYRIVDEECLAELPSSTRAVICPTVRRVDRRTWAALHMLAETGMRVVIGPTAPTHDELDVPLADEAALPLSVGLIEKESARDLSGLAADLAAVAGDLEEAYFAIDAERVEVSALRDSAGGARAIFVTNRSGDALRAAVALPDPVRCANTGLRVEADAIELAPHQVRLLLPD